MEFVEFSLEFRNKRWRDAHKGLTALGKSLEDGMAKLGPVLGKEMGDFLELIATAMSQRHGNPWPGGTSEKTLASRSGDAMKSIHDSVKVIGKTLADIQGEIGGVGYLATHEYGATIRPRKSKYLTVPLPAALNANGTPKKRSAREWENTFVARSKKGNLIIFQKQLSGIVPLYVLKDKVVIPPRLGMRDTINTGIPYFVERSMDAMVDALVREMKS